MRQGDPAGGDGDVAAGKDRLQGPQGQGDPAGGDGDATGPGVVH